MNSEEFARRVSQLKLEKISSDQLRDHPGPLLDRLFAASRKAGFYLPGRPGFAQAQARVFEEIARRRAPKDFEVKDMFKGYVRARMFGDARDLQRRFPSARLPGIPKVIEQNGLESSSAQGKAFSVSEDWNHVSLRQLSLSPGPRIVMGFFPGCSAAESAMEDILADAELGDVFRKSGILLTLRFDAEGVSLWKNHFKFQEIYIADTPQDFPGMSFSSSPSFYFLRDGKIVDQFVGWDGLDGPAGAKARFRTGQKLISG